MSCYGCPFIPKGGLDADAHARWLVGWRVDGVGEPGLCHRYRGIQQQQQQQQLFGRWLVGCSVIFHGNVLRVPREQLQFPGHQCFFSGVRFRRGLFIGHRSIVRHQRGSIVLGRNIVVQRVIVGGDHQHQRTTGQQFCRNRLIQCSGLLQRRVSCVWGPSGLQPVQWTVRVQCRGRL